MATNVLHTATQGPKHGHKRARVPFSNPRGAGGSLGASLSEGGEAGRKTLDAFRYHITM